MFVHAKLCVHKTMTVAINLHCLIYNFPYIFCYQVTLKNISPGCAQRKGLLTLTEYRQVD